MVNTWAASGYCMTNKAKTKRLLSGYCATNKAKTKRLLSGYCVTNKAKTKTMKSACILHFCVPYYCYN
jgi:hypothetical protein